MKLSKIQQNHVVVCLVIVLGFYHGKLLWRKHLLGEYVWNFLFHRRCKSKKGERSVFWYHLKLTQWKNPPGNTQHIPPTGNLGKSSTQEHGYGWGYVIVCRRGHVTVTWGKFALWRDMDINQGMGGMGIKHLFGWWTQFLLSFTPIWGNDPIWLAHSFQMGWWKTTISYNHIPKIHLRRSHMDPNRESKHPSFRPFSLGWKVPRFAEFIRVLGQRSSLALEDSKVEDIF